MSKIKKMGKILVFTKTNDSDIPIRLDIKSIFEEVSKYHDIDIYDNKKCKLSHFKKNSSKNFKINLPFLKKFYFFFNYLSFLYFLILNRNKYDFIQINYVREEYLPLPFLFKWVAKKIYVQVYGSDFYVRNKIRDNFQKLYDYADKINFTNPTLLNKFNDFYKSKHTSKLGIVDLPFLHFDLYNDFTFSKKELAKKALNIPSEKFVLSIGTNTNEFEQHENIISELLKIKQHERFHLIFNLSYYGHEPARCQMLNDLIKEKLPAFEVTVFEGFQTYEQIATIRLATDCLVNLRKTDQLVLSMLESNLAYANVITGSWLPYQDYLNQVDTFVIDKFDQLNTTIEKVIALRKSDLIINVLEKNRQAILNRYSAKKAIEQWLNLYN